MTKNSPKINQKKNKSMKYKGKIEGIFRKYQTIFQTLKMKGRKIFSQQKKKNNIQKKLWE